MVVCGGPVLDVFKSLPVVREVHRFDSRPAVTLQYRSDTITLGWEERLRARGRRRSDQGVDFGAALPRGTVLRDGDCLILERDELVIRIVERDDLVFVIEPETPIEWGLYAYHIGNSHQPVMMTDTAIICPDVPGMENILNLHGIPFVRETRPFTPLGLAGDAYMSDHRHGA